MIHRRSEPLRQPGLRGWRPAILILLCTLPVAAQEAGRRAVELVESVPLETSLDNTDIRNTLEVWLEMVNGATRSLDIEQFYVAEKPGEALDTVLRAIEQAATRGVSVRLIVDSRMYRTYPAAVESLARRPGITRRIIDFGAIAGGIQHAKFFIADGRSVFLGSQNFDWRALSHIHELGLRIDDARVAGAFRRVFELDWALAGSEKTPPAGNHGAPGDLAVPFRIPVAPGDTVTLTPTWSPGTLVPDTSLRDEPSILKLIDGAEHELMLQFLSYSPLGRDNVPYRVIDDALRRAASRGVKVCMIVADWEKATRAEEYLKALSTVPNIELRYSVIPQWSGGYISYARVEHCKYIVADGSRFWLGTSNCERSYFHTSRNVGVVAEHHPLAERLRSVFLKSWGSPYAERITGTATFRPREHGGE